MQHITIKRREKNIIVLSVVIQNKGAQISMSSRPDY